MRFRKRVLAALGIALLCAPGTWLRTEVATDLPRKIALTPIAPAAPLDEAGWDLGGIWHYSTEPDRYFGGFSALVALEKARLWAFSDRGVRFVFYPPDHREETAESRQLARQQVVERAMRGKLWDIESATHDPATGTYWLGYESTHAIQRFSVGNVFEERRDLAPLVDWTNNSGAEAMVRLSDGRFLVLGEGQDEALIFPADPAQGGTPQTVPFVTPAESYAVTDITQLPDGRLLLLMRNVAWGYPPFESLIAIAPPPEKGSTAAWSPKVALRFDGIIPNENYEGIAVRAPGDGSADSRVEVWVISDDNFSVMQRTLLVKLLFDPDAGD